MNKKEQIELMGSGRIRRTVKRMVFQIAEIAKGRDILLVGINERGMALAKEMSENLKPAAGQKVDLVNLPVDKAVEAGEEIRNTFGLKERVVVMVDDVIFSGKTMFKALKNLMINLDPEVYTAVLIDRGHRTIPVMSGFVGLDLPTKPNEHVEVILKNEMADKVVLYKKT